jgi:hypothetical protein
MIKGIGLIFYRDLKLSFRLFCSFCCEFLLLFRRYIQIVAAAKEAPPIAKRTINLRL